MSLEATAASEWEHTVTGHEDPQVDSNETDAAPHDNGHGVLGGLCTVACVVVPLAAAGALWFVAAQLGLLWNVLIGVGVILLTVPWMLAARNRVSERALELGA